MHPFKCRNEPGKHDLALHESCCSSVVSASEQCMEGHGFDSHWELRFFALYHA